MTALHVTFKVGDAEYVIPAAQVLHLETFERATPVPGAPAFVAGLTQIRGRLIPVVDVRTRFGLPPIAPSLDRRVVVVQSQGRVAGLLVDSAREVVQLDPDRFEDPPEMIDRQAAGFVKAVATQAQHVYLLIDVARVIHEGELHA